MLTHLRDRITDAVRRATEVEQLLSDPETVKDAPRLASLGREHHRLADVVVKANRLAKAELELADARGVTVGTKWRDVQAQFARPTHGCQYQAQAVSNDGILALLRSSAPIFGDHCSDRQPMAAPDLPDMASVVISGLRAGRMVGHVPAD